MKRHFYLIISILLCVSVISAVYSQEQNTVSADSNKVEEKSDIKKPDEPPERITGSDKAVTPADLKDEDSNPGQADAESDDSAEAKKKDAKGVSRKPSLENEQAREGDAPKDQQNNTDVSQKPKPVRGRSFLLKKLLDVDDEDYKYVRIPEYKVNTQDKTSVLEVASPDKEIDKTEEAIPEAAEEESEKGLFGISKSTTDILTKGVLIVFILLILVLYNLRSKGSSRTVLRRFPK